MKELLFAEGIGIVLLVIGILNTKGNISTIHRYHRHRVKEEDVLPFGRLVGAGTISAAVALMILGAMQYLAEVTTMAMLLTIGSIVMVLGIAVCVVLCLYAMIKYNKGIF